MSSWTVDIPPRAMAKQFFTSIEAAVRRMLPTVPLFIIRTPCVAASGGRDTNREGHV